jgi:hypothetical protein
MYMYMLHYSMSIVRFLDYMQLHVHRYLILACLQSRSRLHAVTYMDPIGKPAVQI